MIEASGRWRVFWVVLLLCLPACTFSGVEGLGSLRDKPALPYSVLLTGGSFVESATDPSSGDVMRRTFASDQPGYEPFSLEQLRRTLESGRVFVTSATDSVGIAARRTVSDGPSLADASLQAALRRARAGGHDFLLVVERIQDGPVELREINDRWPFTLAAWLFALGALIPDHTYESAARLRVSLRDAYTGRRVSDQQIIVEAGPIDLSMLERCGLLGFVQSVLWPPFFTSTDPGTIVASMREASTPRLLISLVRRVKSAEVRDQLYRSGGILITAARVAGGWQFIVKTQEPISEAELRSAGQTLQTEAAEAFVESLLRSSQRVGERLEYRATYGGSYPSGGTLQIAVQTEAAKARSMTLRLGED